MTDLEKFKKLYTSWGIELKIWHYDDISEIHVNAKKINDKYRGYHGYTKWIFDYNEKFLYQECDS